MSQKGDYMEEKKKYRTGEKRMANILPLRAVES